MEWSTSSNPLPVARLEDFGPPTEEPTAKLPVARIEDFQFAPDSPLSPQFGSLDQTLGIVPRQARPVADMAQSHLEAMKPEQLPPSPVLARRGVEPGVQRMMTTPNPSYGALDQALEVTRQPLVSGADLRAMQLIPGLDKLSQTPIGMAVTDTIGGLTSGENLLILATMGPQGLLKKYPQAAHLIGRLFQVQMTQGAYEGAKEAAEAYGAKDYPAMQYAATSGLLSGAMAAAPEIGGYVSRRANERAIPGAVGDTMGAVADLRARVQGMREARQGLDKTAENAAWRRQVNELGEPPADLPVAKASDFGPAPSILRRAAYDRRRATEPPTRRPVSPVFGQQAGPPRAEGLQDLRLEPLPGETPTRYRPELADLELPQEGDYTPEPAGPTEGAESLFPPGREPAERIPLDEPPPAPPEPPRPPEPAREISRPIPEPPPEPPPQAPPDFVDMSPEERRAYGAPVPRGLPFQEGIPGQEVAPPEADFKTYTQLRREERRGLRPPPGEDLPPDAEDFNFGEVAIRAENEAEFRRLATEAGVDPVSGLPVETELQYLARMRRKRIADRKKPKGAPVDAAGNKMLTPSQEAFRDHYKYAGGRTKDPNSKAGLLRAKKAREAAERGQREEAERLLARARAERQASEPAPSPEPTEPAPSQLEQRVAAKKARKSKPMVEMSEQERADLHRTITAEREKTEANSVEVPGLGVKMKTGEAAGPKEAAMRLVQKLDHADHPSVIANAVAAADPEVAAAAAELIKDRPGRMPTHLEAALDLLEEKARKTIDEFSPEASEKQRQIEDAAAIKEAAREAVRKNRAAEPKSEQAGMFEGDQGQPGDQQNLLEERGKQYGKGEGQKQLFDAIDSVAPVSRSGALPPGPPPRSRRIGEGSGVKTLASRLKEGFRKLGRIEFRGQVIESAHDLAAIAQVARSPHTETYRLFYVDDAGKILGHEAVTSADPSFVTPHGQETYRNAKGEIGTPPRIAFAMKDRMRRLGATGYWALHNHPSGNPLPSPQDVVFTRRLAEGVDGMRGQVVIDHEAYSYVSPQGDVSVHEMEARGTEPLAHSPADLAHEFNAAGLFDLPIRSHGAVAHIGATISVPKNNVLLIYADVKGIVRAVQSMPISLFNNVEKAADWIRGRRRDFGSASVFGYFDGGWNNVTQSADTLIRRGALRDFVYDRANARGSSPESRSQGYGVNPEADWNAGRRMKDIPTVKIEERGEGYGPNRPLEDAAETPEKKEYRVSDAGRTTWYTKPDPDKFSMPRGPRPEARVSTAEALPVGGASRAAELFKRDIERALSVASLSDATRASADLLRRAESRAATAREQAGFALEEARRNLWLPKAEMIEFRDAIETGRIDQLPPEQQPYARTMRKLLDEGRADVQARTGRLEQFIENYFPHIWRQTKKLELWMNRQKPFEGNTGFLKQRTVPTFKDGIAAGLEPEHWNPVDDVVQRIYEMKRFAEMHEAANALKPYGIAVEVDARSTDLRPGWTWLDDRLGQKFGGQTVPVGETVDAKLMGQLEKLAERLGIKHERLAGVGPTQGYSEQGADYVRTRFGSGTGTLTHEIGHQLDHKFNLWGRMVTETVELNAKGQKTTKSLKLRATVNKELRDLADLRTHNDKFELKGAEFGPSPKAQREYVRTQEEKIAQMLDAYINERDLMRKAAPTVLSRLESIIDTTPEMKGLREMRREPWANRGEIITDVPVGGRILKSKIMVPVEVGELFKRHLSVGLAGKGWYRALRTAGNSLLQFRLGWSAFHALVTGIEESVNQVALANRYLAAGEYGKAGKALAMAPVAAPVLAYRGGKIRKGIRAGDPKYDHIRELLEGAGGRIAQDSHYATGLARSFADSVRRIRGGTDTGMGAVGGAAKALAMSPWALTDLVSRPIMEKWVPSLKVGAFARLMEAELERLGPNAHEMEIRHAAGRVWDSVDNRLGQLTYSNLFWDKTFKDLSMVGVTSLGWNLGTIREIGGGIKDLATLKSRVNAKARIAELRDIEMKKGDKGVYIPDLTDAKVTGRMSYVVALPVAVGILGGTMNFAMTGEAPKELRDYYYPRTGRKNADGSDERLSLPTYMRDVFAYALQPGKTLQHKVHPLLTGTMELLENKNFYGEEIRHEDDPAYKQGLSVLKYAAGLHEPIAKSNQRRIEKEGGSTGEKVAGFLGFQRAPAYITKSAAQKEMSRYGAAVSSQEPRTSAQVEKSDTIRKAEQYYRIGRRDDANAQIRTALEKGVLGMEDVDRLRQDLQTGPVEHQFKGLGLEEKIKVYKLATPEDRRKMKPYLDKTVQDKIESGEFSKMSPLERKIVEGKIRDVYAR